MSHTRNRLNELHKQRDNVQFADETKTVKDDKDIKATLEKANQIREWISTIENNTKRADDILKDNSFHLSKALQEELNAKFDENASLAFRINGKLEELGKTSKSDKSRAKNRIHNLQYLTLKQSFREAITGSDSCLEYHKSIRQNLLKKSLKTVGKNVQDEELEELLSKNQSQAFIDDYLVQTEEAKRQLNDIEDRHKELLIIEKHLTDVRDLFTRIGLLVEQQQESINRVEYHAATATDYVEQGVVDIGKSARRQKTHRKRKIYIIGGIIIILVLVIVIMLIV